jgi:hypothetical protein
LILILSAWAQYVFSAEPIQLARMNPYVAGGAGAASCADSSCTGFLSCQNFAGTGYDNSETWTEYVGPNGIVDEDDTTATVLRGAQQLKIYAGDSGQLSYSLKTFTEAGELWFHVLYKTPDTTPSNSIAFLQVGETGSPQRGYINLLTVGTYRCYQGTAYGTGSTTLQDNTAYHIFGRYKAETSDGANDGIFQIWIGTSASRGASPDCSVITGTAEQSVSRFRLLESYQHTAYYDQVLIHTTEFTSVCE